MGQRHGAHSRGKVKGVSGLSLVETEHGVESKGKDRDVYCWCIGKRHRVDSRDKGEGVSSLSSVGTKHLNESRVECGGEIVSRVSLIEGLPEECISNIIVLTSPRDACVAALVSKTIKSAVDSDATWEKFLPPEYASLIPASRVFSSKKELYFSLCNHFLIEDSKKSFWLEKATGKKCIMLSALDLSVTYEDDDSIDPEYWKWYPVLESRFEKVGEIVTTFDIYGSTDSSILSPGTIYSAFVVFKKLDHFSGFEDSPIEAFIMFGMFFSRRIVCFDPAMDEEFEGYNGRLKPKDRKDGWMELELGDFVNERGLMASDEINVTASQYKSNRWMDGLIIEGIEIRPTENQQRFFELEE